MNNTEAGSGDGAERISTQMLENAAAVRILQNVETLNRNGQEFEMSEVSEKTQVATFRLYERRKEEMLGEIGMLCSNLSTLSSQFLDSCTKNYQDVNALAEKWIKQISASQQRNP